MNLPLASYSVSEGKTSVTKSSCFSLQQDAWDNQVYAGTDIALK